jgi:hypothetical protein
MTKRALVALVASTAILGVAYFAYDLWKRRDNPCETIFQQTRVTLGSSLDVIRAKGALVLGEEKLQDLTERSQIVAINLKTCCIVLQAGKLSADEFLRCKASVEDYERRIARVATAVGEAHAVGEPTALPAAARQEVEATLRSAEATSQSLAQQVQALVPDGGSKAGPSSTLAPAPTAADETEPNDGFAAATTLALGATARGALGGGNDRDFWRLRSEPGRRDRFRVALVNGSMGFSPKVRAYNGRKSEVGDAYDATLGANLDLVFVASPDEDQYVEVTSWGGTGGPYELRVVAERAFDAYEPNDDALAPSTIALGETIAANLLDGHDVDWYRVTGITAARIAVRLDNRSTTLAPDVHVYDRNRAEVARAYNATNGASLDLVAPAAAGADAYVRVTRWSGSGGAYHLAVRAAPE